MTSTANTNLIHHKYYIVESVEYNKDTFIIAIDTTSTDTKTEFVTGILYCDKFLYEIRTFNSKKKAVTNIANRIKAKLFDNIKISS